MILTFDLRNLVQDHCTLLTQTETYRLLKGTCLARPKLSQGDKKVLIYQTKNSDALKLNNVS